MSSEQRPLPQNPPVVEVRLAEQLHVDRALHAEHGPNQEVMGILVGGSPRMRGDLVLVQGRRRRGGGAAGGRRGGRRGGGGWGGRGGGPGSSRRASILCRRDVCLSVF